IRMMVTIFITTLQRSVQYSKLSSRLPFIFVLIRYVMIVIIAWISVKGGRRAGKFFWRCRPSFFLLEDNVDKIEVYPGDIQRRHRAIRPALHNDAPIPPLHSGSILRGSRQWKMHKVLQTD